MWPASNPQPLFIVFIVMEVSNKIIKKVLEHLVSPKWDGIVEYLIEPSTHDDTGVVHYVIDVIFDITGYWATYHAGDYDYSDQMDEEISDDVRNAVKYLGINKTFVTLYVRDEDGNN